MTTLELKAQIIQEIDSEQNTAILKKLQAYYHKLKGTEKSMPCVMTVEELRKEVSQAVDDINNGRVTTQDKLLEEIETW